MERTPPRITSPAVTAARMPMRWEETGNTVCTASVIAEDWVVQPTPKAARMTQAAYTMPRGRL